MPTILCADDSPDIRRLVRSVLTRDGMDVLVVSDGAEALEAMVRRRPDLVLLDINMPLMDGLEVLRRMGDDVDLAGVPVMMLTANAFADNVQEAMRRGARDFVVKPFEAYQLRQRVRKLIDAEPPPPSLSARSRPESGIGTRVLVVDDQPAVLEIASQLLTERYVVETARSGAGALSAAARLRPDIVLLDTFMPVMDGAEARARLRQLPGFTSVPILALSMGTPDEQPLLAEFDAIVQKPLERAALVPTLCRALGTTGLYAFLPVGDAAVLRCFPAKLWDPREGHLQPTMRGAPGSRGWWDSDDVLTLEGDLGRALARMLEGGQTRLIIDLERMGTLPDRFIGIVISAVRAVSSRARAVGVQTALVLPVSQQRAFSEAREDVATEVFWRLSDATRPGRRAARNDG